MADEAKLRECFNKFDADGSGFIKKGEVKAVLEDMGLSGPDVENIAKNVMEDGDADGDAKISWEEFKNHFSGGQ